VTHAKRFTPFSQSFSIPEGRLRISVSTLPNKRKRAALSRWSPRWDACCWGYPTTAAGGARGTGSGFDRDHEGLDLAGIVSSWQHTGDERLFKIIVSPEFGEQMDLVQHTRELVSRMERDLHTKLEWAAVTHFNTDHPHVHIVLRGLDDKGVSLRLERDYIRHGVCRHAEGLATNQFGFRTTTQVLEAQANETKQQRYTSLDQIISRWREANPFLLPTAYQGSHFVIQHQSTQFPLQGEASREPRPILILF